MLTRRIEEASKQDCDDKQKRQSAVDELLGMVKGMMKEDLEFDDTIVRQLVEYIKVIDMDTLLVVFKDGSRTEENL